MKKTAIYEQVEASKLFNPYSLKDFLTRTEEGDVIVDRNRLLKTQDDLRLFYIILNKDYRWDYRYPETSTIFFRIENGQITGGVYEMSIGSRSQRVIVVPRDQAKASDYNVYAYEPKDVEAIIKCIKEAK